MELEQQINIRLTSEDLEELKLRARKDGRSVSSYVRELVKKDISNPFYEVYHVKAGEGLVKLHFGKGEDK